MDYTLKACEAYRKEIKVQADEIDMLKRELVHFKAKAKRLDRENINHRVDLRMYRKRCLDYDDE